MSSEFLIRSIFIIIIISGVPLVISSGVSMIVAFLQTITQIQEQTLTYIIKCMVIGVCFYFGYEYFQSIIFDFFNMAFEQIVKQGRLS